MLCSLGQWGAFCQGGCHPRTVPEASRNHKTNTWSVLVPAETLVFQETRLSRAQQLRWISNELILPAHTLITRQTHSQLLPSPTSLICYPRRVCEESSYSIFRRFISLVMSWNGGTAVLCLQLLVVCLVSYGLNVVYQAEHLPWQEKEHLGQRELAPRPWKSFQTR